MIYCGFLPVDYQCFVNYSRSGGKTIGEKPRKNGDACEFVCNKSGIQFG
jgi:hypothetical protein